MKETINVNDGKGVIHLTGSASEVVLYVKKEPRMACFFAEVGTVIRYHIGQEISEDLLGEHYAYERLVKEGKIVTQQPLSEQFHHLTKLLTNGSYRLHLCEFPWSFGILPAIPKNEGKKYYERYGGTADLIATQTYLDNQVVETYKKAIAAGARPTVVLYKLEASWAIFILDGHHKLHAYQQLKKNPQALVISKLDYTTVEARQGVELLKQLGLDDVNLIETYQAERRTNAHERNFYHYYSQGLQTYFKAC